MSNKNSVMTAKERKVKMYDIKLAVRNLGNDCTRYYDEGLRTWSPPKERKPYECGAALDVSKQYRVWYADGRSLFFPQRLDALAAMYSRGGIRMRTPDGAEYVCDGDRLKRV